MNRLNPKRLMMRFVLVTVAMLIATYLSYSWMMTRMQDRLVYNTMRRTAPMIALTLADSAGHHLERGEKVALEHLLRNALQLPNMSRVQVLDASGQAVMGMELKECGREIVPTTLGSARLQVPAGKEAVVVESESSLLVWQPILVNGKGEWLQATYSLSPLRQIKENFWRKSLLMAVVWICLGTLFVVTLFRRPVASIVELSEFAHELPNHQGEQIKINTKTVEIRQLADALNTASRELKSRQQQLLEEGQHLTIALDELKRTEEISRRQQEFLTTVLESLTHPFYVIDANTYEIILANSAARQEDVTPGATCHFITHGSPTPCHEDAHPCPLELVKKSRQAVMVEHVHQDNKGNRRIFEVHGYPIYDEAGNVVQMLEYSLDVTERKMAQEDVHRNEMRLAALFRISQVKATSVEELLDHALEEALMLSGSRIGFVCRFEEESQELTLCSWSKGVTGGEFEERGFVWPLEKTGMLGDPLRERRAVVVNDFQQPYPSKRGTPSGHMMVHRFVGIPVFDDERIVALLGVANRDDEYTQKDVDQLTQLMDPIWKIVERMTADAALRQLNEELEERVASRTSQLEEANKELESFCYSVSHDLRAPLRHIDGFGRILEEEFCSRMGDDAQSYIRKMRQATDRMGQLIDALLQLSRVGRSAILASKVNLSRMAEDIVTELQFSQPGRLVDIHIQQDVWATADPRLIRITLDNLLGNAWKYASKGEKTVISFGTVERDGKECYFVRDNGVGFDMAYAHKLFGAFQRLHRADEFEGSGVGLATVQRIIHRHGGKVWAEAAVGEGATFYFTLGAA